MKYLMSGLTLSVVLAIAMPAWAQAPTTPPQTRAVTGSGHRATTRHHVGPSQSQDNSANQLNAQELTTLQSGSSSIPVQQMPSGGRGLTSPNRGQ
jgi:hypothetical protein